MKRYVMKLFVFVTVLVIGYAFSLNESYGALLSHKVEVVESEDGRLIYEDAKGEKYDITSLKDNYVIYKDRLIINCRTEFDISCVSGEDWLSKPNLEQSFNVKQGTDKKFKTTVIDDGFIASADGTKRIDFYVYNILKEMKLDNKVIFLGKIKKLNLKREGSASKIGGVEWKSSDESIVSVDSGGRITAHKEGEAIVSVVAKALPTITASCKVTVVAEPEESVDELLGLDKQADVPEVEEMVNVNNDAGGAKEEENTVDADNKDNKYVVIFIVSSAVFVILALYGVVRVGIRKAKKS